MTPPKLDSQHEAREDQEIVRAASRALPRCERVWGRTKDTTASEGGRLNDDDDDDCERRREMAMRYNTIDVLARNVIR